MAFILVLILHKSEAYSSMAWQIAVLQVQSKLSISKAAMQPLHDACQNFVNFFSRFWQRARTLSVFCREASDFASAK
ncbi:hypothetical protein [Tabrizicola sp.]|uniref:hypothetical protein n=1 Tax=Tabrizicola sp. TaxID=2005166 RepID=UPI003F2BA982